MGAPTAIAQLCWLRQPKSKVNICEHCCDSATVICNEVNSIDEALIVLQGEVARREAP
jgi:hypothetical protein